QFNLDCGGANHGFRFFVRDTLGNPHLCNSTNGLDGNWHHVVGVMDGAAGLVHLYVDAVEVTNTANTAGVKASSNPVSVGARQSGTGPYDLNFVGTIDEVAIYHSALNGDQVASHYSLGLPPVLTVSADEKTKVYGAPLPALTVSYSGFVSGDDSTILTGAPALSTTVTSGSGVGNYPISITKGTLASSKSYRFSFSPANISVTPAPLIITADNKTKTQGLPNPALTASFSGFVNGDDMAALSSPPALTTTATANAKPGSYVITASGAAAANYTISYVDGILTVVAPPAVTTSQTGNNLTLTWSTVAGQSYQVLFTDDLGNPWQPLGNVQTGDGSPLSVTFDTTTAPHRFYQIQIQ
ncbi:MAG TPA: MBG domain-containing protein, partial [Verrucomicrobiae bacterium]